jgi:hypothetical protein
MVVLEFGRYAASDRFCGSSERNGAYENTVCTVALHFVGKTKQTKASQMLPPDRPSEPAGTGINVQLDAYYVASVSQNR